MDFAALLKADLIDRMTRVRFMLLLFLTHRGQRFIGADMGVAHQELAATLGIDLVADSEGLGALLKLPEEGQLQETLSGLDQHILARQARCEAEGIRLPFEQVRRAFDLDDTMVRLLEVEVAAQHDIDLYRALRMAWSDFTQKRPTVGFLRELLQLGGRSTAMLEDALDVQSPVIAFQLLRLHPNPDWPDTPQTHCFVTMPDAVSRYLRGGPSRIGVEGDSVRSWWVEEGPSPDLESLTLSAEVVAQVVGPLDPTRSSPPRFALLGLPGSGRRTLLRTLSAQTRRRVVTIDLAGVIERKPGGDLGEAADQGGNTPLSLSNARATLTEGLRAAMLLDAVVVLRNGDALIDVEDRISPRQLLSMLRLVGRCSVPIAFTSTRPLALLERAWPGVIEVPFPVPPTSRQVALWQHLLASNKTGIDRLEGVAQTLGRHYNLTPGAVHDTVSQARLRARRRAPGSRPRVEDLTDIIRRRFDHRLSKLASIVSTQLSWDDLVLSSTLRASLDEILARVRHREKVLDGWGFGRKLDRGRGVTCLFEGPPGTGKTMTALLVARDLGRETYRIDLSKVVDKYIGETEKNLGKIFDEADQAQAILLFDEADSLFAKRTAVKSSNDRYANLEVNYLLQRLEAYEGISILTTNFEAAIDEAFKRRIQFRLHFPFPEAEERARLWRAMIPEEASCEGEFDWLDLAELYEVSGGSIKNAVLHAAFTAAHAGGPLRIDHLHEAAILECRKMGKLINYD